MNLELLIIFKIDGYETEEKKYQYRSNAFRFIFLVYIC